MEVLGKLTASALTLLLALTPFWLYLTAQHLLDPQGFWQRLLVVGVGVYFLGGLQIIFLILWLMFTVYILVED